MPRTFKVAERTQVAYGGRLYSAGESVVVSDEDDFAEADSWVRNGYAVEAGRGGAPAKAPTAARPSKA